MAKVLVSKVRGSYAAVFEAEAGSIEVCAIAFSEEDSDLSCRYVKERLGQCFEKDRSLMSEEAFDRLKERLSGWLSAIDRELYLIGKSKGHSFMPHVILGCRTEGSFITVNTGEGRAFLFSPPILRSLSGSICQAACPLGSGKALPSLSDGVLPSGAALILTSGPALVPAAHRALEELLSSPGFSEEALEAVPGLDGCRPKALVIITSES